MEALPHRVNVIEHKLDALTVTVDTLSVSVNARLDAVDGWIGCSTVCQGNIRIVSHP